MNIRSIVILALIFSRCAFGQATEVTSKDTLVYGDEVIKIERMPGGKEYYGLGDNFYVFDPLTHAIAMFWKPGGLLTVETTKKEDGFKEGATWKTTVISPSYIRSGCSDQKVEWVHTVTSQKESTVAVLVDGKETSIPVVSSEHKGTWSNRCGQGESFRKISYSPTLRIIVHVERIAYFRGSVSSESKHTLKEIRRGY